MSSKNYTVIGLMSGTSMDGVDAALIETDGKSHIRPIGHIFIAYPNEAKNLFRAAEYIAYNSKANDKLIRRNFENLIRQFFVETLSFTAHQAEAEVKGLEHWLLNQPTDLLALDFEHIIRLSSYYHLCACRELCEELSIAPESVDLVGYHGQTLYHSPRDGITFQAGHGGWLAEHFGCQVVDDFRSNDVASGGEGAPFAPLYHQALAEQMELTPIIVVNCGGIANVTILPENRNEILAFDTGPANCLIDRLVREHSKGAQAFDRDGALSSQGSVHDATLKALYSKSTSQSGRNYYTLDAPKSLDSNDLSLVDEIYSLSIEDGCRTLCAFSAETIIEQVITHSKGKVSQLPSKWLLAGGGWKNPAIYDEFCQRISRHQDNATVLRAEEVKWDADSLEAQLFAYLAVRSLQGLPLSLPGTTGVPKPITGGQIHIPRHKLQ